MGQIDVLIVDRQAMVREGVKRLLAGAPDVCVAGEAGDDAEAIRLLRDTHCDIILLDVSVPDGESLATLRAIRGHDARLPILVLGMFAEDRGALSLLKAGAAGYIEQQDAPAELLSAIRRVAEGGHYIGTALAARLSRDVAPPGAAPVL